MFRKSLLLLNSNLVVIVFFKNVHRSTTITIYKYPLFLIFTHGQTLPKWLRQKINPHLIIIILVGVLILIIDGNLRVYLLGSTVTECIGSQGVLVC